MKAKHVAIRSNAFDELVGECPREHPADLLNGGRRRLLKAAGAGALGALTAPTLAFAKQNEGKPRGGDKHRILMDGHVHVTSAAYWLGTDVWKPQPPHTGWNFAEAYAAGVNVIVENLSTYSYWNFNYTPKHMLRLIENFHEIAETHQDKMGVALTVADARRIAKDGRMAVFLSVESGWDHEGDIDVLRALYRLGLRGIQFATQTGFNNLADSGASTFWGGVSPNGKNVIAEANRLGVFLDITHASPAAQSQIVELSRAPVVASHVTPGGFIAGGISDAVIQQLAAKGGVMGLHGGAASSGKRYRAWQAANPATAAALGAPLTTLVNYRPSYVRNQDTDNYGAYIAQFDADNRQHWADVFKPFVDDPVALTQIPTVDEWAEMVTYVSNLVGPDHVGIGLDMFGGRSHVIEPGGYQDLAGAIERVTTPENARKIEGENWLRVLDQIFAMAG